MIGSRPQSNHRAPATENAFLCGVTTCVPARSSDGYVYATDAAVVLSVPTSKLALEEASNGSLVVWE
jgi:hypothetical protein